MTESIAGEQAPEAPDMSRRVAKGVSYLLMLFVLVASFQLNTILSALPGIFAAVLVVGVAHVVGRVVSGLATNMHKGVGFDKLPARLGIANAALLSTIARVSILILAGAMGLQQMELAQEIVNLEFGITFGAVAVAAAIAFGIGGREAAKKLVDDFVDVRRQTKLGGRRRETRMDRILELY